MSNRSYLYSLDFNPSEREKTDEDIVHGLSEWKSSIPLAYLVIASANPQLCKSLIWEHEHPIAIIADYDKGVKKLLGLLDTILWIGAFDAGKLKEEIEKSKTFLNDPAHQGKYIFLELGEIFEFTDEPFEVQAQNIMKELKQIDKTIADYLVELKEWKKKKDEHEISLKIHDNFLFKFIFRGIGVKRKQLLEKEMQQLNDRKWFDLGIEEWTDILYFSFNEEDNDEEDDYDEATGMNI